jgi:4-amino-4-deoxy-L-arabinose transferase-like glycosyltransferase
MPTASASCDETPISSGKPFFTAGTICNLVAIAILAFLAALAIQHLEGFDPKYPDPDGWGQRGFWIAEGRGLTDNNGQPSAMRGPVIPIIFAGAIKVWGYDYANLLPVQAVFFALSITFVAIISQLVFAKWKITWLTTALIILYVPAWPWVSNIFSEPIFTAFQAIFLWCWIRTLEHPRTLGRWFALGILFALVALCRPVMYFFLPFLLVYSLWRCGFSRRMAIAMLCFFVGFALLETPWVVRNYRAFDKLILTTTGSSQVLHAATWYQHPNYMGNIYHDPERFPPAGEGFWDLSHEEQDRRFREMALQNWKEAPGQVLMLIPRRTMLFFFQMRPFGWIPTPKSIILSSVLYPAALFGFFAATRSQRRTLVPVLLIIGFTAAFYSLLQAEYRYSHPIQPFIIMLAAAGLWDIFERCRRKLFGTPGAELGSPST